MMVIDSPVPCAGIQHSTSFSTFKKTKRSAEDDEQQQQRCGVIFGRITIFLLQLIF